MPQFIERYYGDQQRSYGIQMNPVLRPIEDIHLYGQDTRWQCRAVGDRGAGTSDPSISPSLVAAFVLVIACINFVNLTTARATRRAREVSMRKVLGSSRMHVVLQFIGESVLLTLFALVLAVALLQVILPSFNQLFDKGIAMDLSLDLVLTLTGDGLARRDACGNLSSLCPLVLSADGCNAGIDEDRHSQD